MHDLLGGAVIDRLRRAVLVEDAVVREEGAFAVRERVAVGRGLRKVFAVFFFFFFCGRGDEGKQRVQQYSSTAGLG